MSRVSGKAGTRLFCGNFEPYFETYNHMLFDFPRWAEKIEFKKYKDFEYSLKIILRWAMIQEETGGSRQPVREPARAL